MDYECALICRRNSVLDNICRHKYITEYRIRDDIQRSVFKCNDCGRIMDDYHIDNEIIEVVDIV